MTKPPRSFATLLLRLTALPVQVASLAVMFAGPVSAADPSTTPATPSATPGSVPSAGDQGNDGSGSPSISADGRFVAFVSGASNLVPGDTNGPNDTSYGADIFVRDRTTGTTERVSVSSAGEEGNVDSYYPSISADGRLVAFYSDASNLVPGDTNGTGDVFVRDLVTGTTERVSVSSARAAEPPSAPEAPSASGSAGPEP